MDWGLILCDDGSKGAYEIGVWKGLLESDIKLSMVCSASTSLVNGALIAQGNLTKALDYWSCVPESPLIALNHQLAEKYAKEWAGLDEKQLDAELRKVLNDDNPLYQNAKDHLSIYLDRNTIRRSSVDFLLQTYTPQTFEPVRIAFPRLHSSQWLDYILTGYYYPIFHAMDASSTEKPEESDILDAALDQKIQQWMTVGFPPSSVSRWKKRNPQIQNMNIIPSEYVGLSMDTNQESLLRKLVMGQLDLLKTQGHLHGKSYYLDLEGDQSIWQLFNSRLDQPLTGDSGMKVSLLLELDGSITQDAVQEKLQNLLSRTTFKGQPLPLSMLELAARFLHMPRLKRYTADEMIQEIFKTVNALLSKHLEEIKTPDYISSVFHQDPDSYHSMGPMSFLSSYVYFLSLKPSSRDILSRLTSQFNPETLLAITALMYLGQK